MGRYDIMNICEKYNSKYGLLFINKEEESSHDELHSIRKKIKYELFKYK